jgi:hypothetical protein
VEFDEITLSLHLSCCQICKANGFSFETGGPMTVVQGKLEELKCLPGVDKVVKIFGAM